MGHYKFNPPVIVRVAYSRGASEETIRDPNESPKYILDVTMGEAIKSSHQRRILMRKCSEDSED